MVAGHSSVDESTLLREALAASEQSLAEANQQIALLSKQLEWLKKQLFGGGKGERLDSRQLELLLQGLDHSKVREAEPAALKIEYERRAPSRVKPTREESYGNLPVLEEVVIEPEEVKADPDAFERIGEDETFEVDVDPPRFYRRKMVYPKYRRKARRDQAPVVAPSPARPVAGIASIGLLAFIIVSKYVDHLPLARQCRIYERSGVKLSRKSMVRWVEVVADWLKPIYNHMRVELLASDYVQADETPIRYCDRDMGMGKSRQGFLCAATRPGDNVLFAWSTSRSGEAITEMIRDYHGIVQCDAYAGYGKFARLNPKVELVACMAHIRRKFKESLEEDPLRAALVLRLIGRLYHYEAQWREALVGAKLTGVYRSSHSRMTFDLLGKLIEKIAERTLPASNLGKACAYALNQWKLMERYLDHGHVQIDNNCVENAIRPSALGKRNWLFIGHPAAGDRPAIIYSILISCQRFGHNPLDYIKDVLHRLAREPDRCNPHDPASLTPKNWHPSASDGYPQCGR